MAYDYTADPDTLRVEGFAVNLYQTDPRPPPGADPIPPNLTAKVATGRISRGSPVSALPPRARRLSAALKTGDSLSATERAGSKTD